MPPSSYRACPPGVLAWSLGSVASAAGCCQGNSPPWIWLLHRSTLSRLRTLHHARARPSHVSALSKCRIAACACARARMPRSRSGTRGCTLRRRLRHAAPPPRALRPTGPRARRTPCWCRGLRSWVCSGRLGQAPPRRRAPLDATGRRPCGCPPSADAASAARPPRPLLMLGAQACRHAASAAGARGRQALQTPS